MENWFSIAVAVFLLGMVLYGHFRGFIRLSVSALALVATLAIAHTAMPGTADFLKNNTKLYSAFSEGMKRAVGLDEAGQQPDIEQPARQRELIEELPLPKQMKRALLENNNHEIYQALGVERFTDYLSHYLADTILNITGFLALFVLIFAAIKIVTVWLDLVARLPILSGLNKIAGAILGGAEGLMFLWIFFLFLTAFAGTPQGMELIMQIERSRWLSFLYDFNILNGLVMSVAQNVL